MNKQISDHCNYLLNDTHLHTIFSIFFVSEYNITVLTEIATSAEDDRSNQGR